MNESSDWQLKNEKLSERGKYLLDSGLWSDCKFVVGIEPNTRTFTAHKMILSMTSPVFEAMFYGGLAEQKTLIPIPDVQTEAFESMLEYIYTDEAHLASIEQACELCYAAKKYMLPFLVTRCTNFIWRDIDYLSACRAYEFAKLFDEPDLMGKCLEIISKNTTLVLSDKSFADVQQSTLIAILDMEKLNISSEMELIIATFQWATQECKRKGLKVDSQECLRSVLGNALTKIRFLTLKPSEFAASSAVSLLLTQNEAYTVLMRISSPDTIVTIPDDFCNNTVPRYSPAWSSGGGANWLYCCKRTIVQQVIIQNYSQLDSYCTFMVNKDIVMHGLQVPSQLNGINCIGPAMIDSPGYYRPCTLDCMFNRDEQTHNSPSIGNNSYTESINVFLRDQTGKQITSAHFNMVVGFKEVIEIQFNDTAFLCKNTIYKLAVVLNKRGWYPMGTYSKHTNSCAGVEFTFCVGDPCESFRDCIIRAITFTHLPREFASLESVS